MRVEAFHLPSPHGNLFCVAWRPADERAVRFGMLCVLPFAEEANKSRRMIAQQARALARVGGLLLVVDVTGTGDSQSDFAQATAQIWMHDLESAWTWLRAQTSQPLILWGLRLGGLLAVHGSAKLHPKPEAMVLWQPVTSGKTFMHQFLRLALTQNLTAAGEASERVDLKAALKAGATVEVAGYDITPQLSSSIEALSLESDTPSCPQVLWIECVASQEVHQSVGAQRCTAQWQSQGLRVSYQKLECLPFWATQEIEYCESLIAATTQWIEQALPQHASSPDG